MFCKILIILNIVNVLECMDFANDSTNQMDTEQAAIVKRDIERQNRIYEGVKCPAEEFKTIVSLRYGTPNYGSRICGANLIKRNWVLTAAACCGKKTWTFYAVTGITPSGNTKPVVSKVAKWYLYSEYKNKRKNFSSDIALALLEKPIEETEYIKYAKLPRIDLGDIRQFCSESLVKGWGTIEVGEVPKTEQDLQCLDVPVNNHKCKDSLICYIHQDKTGTICFGDSGGPMMCKGIQIGVASYTSVAANPFRCIPTAPQGYVRVDKYLGFIHNIMETQTPRKGCSPNVNCMSIFMWLLVFFTVFKQFLYNM